MIDLSADEVNEIRKELEQNYKVEGDLRREVSSNIKRLMDIGCFRGLRFIVAACPCMASARTPMPAPVRDPPLRRRQEEVAVVAAPVAVCKADGE